MTSFPWSFLPPVGTNPSARADMTTPRRVVVDDTDSRIVYSGDGWFQDNGSLNSNGSTSNGLPYNRTSHGTNFNESFSFSFEGTSIALFGTMMPVNEAGRTLSYECSVEQFESQLSPPRFSISVNNWEYCEFNQLFDGRHTFYARSTIPGITFWVDRLEFTPSPQASFNEVVIHVDHSDAQIIFDSNWKQRPEGKMTSTKGSQAKFDFVGKSVTWIGFIPNNTPQLPASASFSVDGSPFNSFTLNRLPTNWEGSVYEQELFTTPELAPGPHSLVVTYNGSDTGPAIPLTLVYLYVTSTNQTPSVPLPSSDPHRTSSSSSTHQPPSTPLPSSTQPPPSASPPSTSPNFEGHRKSPAPLIGGIIGGLVFLALLAFLYLLWRPRRGLAVRTLGPTNARVSGNRRSYARVTPFTFFQPFTFISRDTPPVVKPSLHSSSTQRLIPSDDDEVEPAPRGEGSNPGIAQPPRAVVRKSQVVAQPNNANLSRHRDGTRRVSPSRESVVTEGPPEYTAG